MIPSVVARQVRETVLDYLRTTFALTDDRVADALFGFLDSADGLFRGPYLDVRLPFQKATAASTIPLDIAPAFTPYRHQVDAFQRLYSRAGHQPQPTLVTTGTGSGKTECFLYPVLDHCFRQRGKSGVKAILLYPMNALAADQARRLAQMLHEDPRLRGQVSAGMFVGGEGHHGVTTREHLVDQRSVLRQSPPDILLTNYRMLDFLLMRPEDQGLWQHNGPDTLRYLVLDELHTYDGAQGSDVACLLRRLKARLQAGPRSICPVGTSATIGGQNQEESAHALLSFASKVFGEEFLEDAIITEKRAGLVETLGERVDDYVLPAHDPRLEATRFDGLQPWIEAQASIWLPKLTVPTAAPGAHAVAVGESLRQHGFLRQVLRALAGKLSSFEDLDRWLCAHESEWKSLGQGHRVQLLESFLGLVSYARKETTANGVRRLEPFLTVQVQIWLRELRHLLRRVSAEPQFAWASDGPQKQGQWLPIVWCRSCGGTGWASFQRESENVLQTAIADIGRAWLNRERSCRYVTTGRASDGELLAEHLDPERLTLQRSAPEAIPANSLPVIVGSDCSTRTPQKFLQRCPECDADQEDGLSLMGSRAPSLLSVAIGHLFQTGYNHDKKLLAFTDSVQDATHGAGFFSARTYRFNLRTAIQGVLEAAGGELPMVGLPERLRNWVASRAGSSLPKALAALLPSDLVELGEYQQFLDSGGSDHQDLILALDARLSWEVTMEYGHSAQVGRTLERTRCSTASLDPDGMNAAAALLAVELAEGDLLDSRVEADEAQVRHFLAGMLQRLRIQGGIHHPLLDRYIGSGGRWIELTKSRQPLLSPFGSQSRLPRFLSEATPDARSVFTSLAAAPDLWTWHRDWAARSLRIDRKDRGILDLYRRALQRLGEKGLLGSTEGKGGAKVWAIRREAITITSRVAVLTCTHCQAEETLPLEVAPSWNGRVCTRYRCKGALQIQASLPETYYGRRYRSGVVERIFAHEHTGMLDREVRERIEDEFKSPSRPDSPNLFVCTPTLEMGVDIGDLSATVLCSVPPTTANYLQRVGRAGRKTGNALCVTMARERPHDLYFHADPLALMRGQVTPPGCFLDAPEMLKRQLVAFAMDAWARQETELRSIPGKTTLILSEEGAQKFPGRFLTFYAEREHKLTDAFFQIFGPQISESNQQRLREFAGARNIRELVTGAFDRIRDEREELRLIQRRTRERKQKLAQDPEAFENPKDEVRLLDDSERLVARLMAELGQKYPLNVLTDAGVLPNYAFPEPGVTLKATLHTRSSGDGERDQYEQRDYIRPASSAIRELAPGNTFYADGHKLRIKELDLGSRAQPLHVSWRMCAHCHHSGMALPTEPVASECPRCGDPTWGDEGQLRQVVKLQRVRSLMTKLEAAVGDDGDDREEAHYQVEDLIDVAPCHRFGARIAPDLPFGIELLKELPLREFNFGALNGRGNGAPSLQVAGRPVTPEGFVTCVDCGRVREDDKPEIQHTSWCPGRRLATAANARESLETVFLYREVRSEAIRVLLPAAEIDKDRRIHSFKAALELGFRRRFAGDPRHLQIRLHDEPVGVEGRMRFLVIFDTVPGGTGYLSELWHGDHFREVLKLAHTALEQCSCQRRDPPADGCYHCLYAYQSQKHLKDLSNLEARGMLQEILQAWPQMEERPTLSGASLASRLESELERFFLRELEAWAKATGKKWQEGVRSGKEFWSLTTGSRTWEIHPQVELGARDGVLIQCRPDFMIKPADGDSSVLPIAIFCDGLEYHVCPNQASSRLADDVQKRSSVILSSSYRVWSVTWKDIEEFRDRRTETKAPLLFERLDARKLTVLFERCGKPLVRDIGTRPSMYMLLDYMENPDRDAWQRAALATSLAWLAAGPFVTPADAARVEQHLSADPTPASAATSTAAPQGVATLARLLDVGGLQILGSCPSASINSPSEWHSLRLTLRLSDDADARKQPQFEGTWRALLQAWNLLQFHHGVSILTTDLVRDSQSPSLTTLPRTDRAPQPSIAADAEDPALQLQPLLDAQIFALVRSIVDRGAPLPQVGYELLVDARVAAEAELAWPDHHVALLLEHQSEGTEAFQKAGWTVVDADEARLAAALRLKPSSKQEPPQ